MKGAKAKEKSWVGSDVDRVDGVLKVTGGARYAADFPADRLAHGVPIQSTIGKGRIVSIDADEALSMPGVIAVITRENLPKLYRAANDFGTATKVGEARMLFEDDVIHYAGQYIGLIVAERLEQAMEAARRVRVAYQEDPPVIALEDALPTAYQPKQMWGENINEKRGAFAKAFSAAPVKIEETYTTPVEHHNPMEPSASVAVWRGDELTLYESSQWVAGARGVVADVLGMPRENVRIVSPFIGGGFGCKGFIWPHTVLAAVASKMTKRPVKVALTRKEMFTSTGHRPATIQKIAAAASKDGKIQALKHDVATETSTVDEFIETCAAVTRMLYAVPNLEVSYKLARVNIATPTPMRAPGESPGLFALESALDELSYKLEMDPVELRMKNYAKKDPENGLPFSSKNLDECYETGMKKFGWKKRKPAPGSMRRDGKRIGWGMATALFPGMRIPGAAKVRIEADGTAVVMSATQDMGGGTYTIMAAITADVLGLPISRVTAMLGDTRFPPAPVSGGSMTTASVGPAVKAAAEEARRKLIEMALEQEESPLRGMKPQQVSTRDGCLVAGKARDSFADVLARGQRSAVEGASRVDPENYEGKYSFYSFGAQFVEVEVDLELPYIRVARVVSVMDVGRIMNQKTARSQVMGAVNMGVGMALMERTVYDERRGRIVNDNLADYLVPVNADAPEIDVHFIDKPDPYFNSIGARGLGEIGITGIPAAIANAVYHACGARFRSLPITPDLLLALI